MEYLPLYLGGFGILVLGLVGFAWYQNERLKKKLIGEARQSLIEGIAFSVIEQQLMGQGLEKAQAAKIIELAQNRIDTQVALELLQQGKTEGEIHTYLVDRGINPELANELIGSAQFTKYCQEHPIISLTLGIVLPLLGIALIGGGIILWLGNKSGRFVTFPFSGHITIVIGVLLFAGGAAFFVRVMRG